MTGLAVLLKTGQVSQVDGGERGNLTLLLLLSDLLTVSPAGLIHVREARVRPGYISLPRQEAQKMDVGSKNTHSQWLLCA